MEQQTSNPTTTTATQQPTQQPPTTNSTLTTTSTTSPNPNPTTTQPQPRPAPPPSNPTQPFGSRPTAFGRSTWPSATSGVAVGAPSQSFGGLGRDSVSTTSSSHSQPKPGMQVVQGMGVIGSSSSIRSAGIPVHHQQRPVQSSFQPPLSSPSSSHTPASSGFPGHGLMRLPPVASPGSPSPNTSQSMTSSGHQPWLQPVAQGKPPLPSPSYRSITPPPGLQQRPHIPQQHHQTLPTSSMHQQISSTHQKQQPSPIPQPQEHYGQQIPPSRIASTVPQQQQQQFARSQGSGMQKPSSLPMAHPGSNQSVLQNRTMSTESDECSNRILSKRSIHDLVSQIDPAEKLDPEVEEILVDIAEDFVESITTFGCSLAKHRKSSTLEAKDILLHLERNWNMALPGYGGDDIKSYRKPPTNDIHKERLAAIKKSIIATESTNNKNPSGQVAGSSKNSLSKTTTSAMGT